MGSAQTLLSWCRLQTPGRQAGFSTLSLLKERGLVRSVAKKRKPPKRARPKRDKRYNPRKGGVDDTAQAEGFMHGITQGLRSVAGTDDALSREEGDGTGTAPWVPVLWWLLILGAGGFVLYRFLQ